jgi:hypothetical protein
MAAGNTIDRHFGAQYIFFSRSCIYNIIGLIIDMYMYEPCMHLSSLVNPDPTPATERNRS